MGRSALPGSGDDRLLARLVVSLSLLLLGGVAAFRLPLSFLPGQTFPELAVRLGLPRESSVEEVAREWIQSLESAIRASGGVRGMAGEVSTRGARLTVRFRSGEDAERKAARLESELGRLRRTLPNGAGLEVWPAGQEAGDNAAVVWLPEAVDPAFLARLRDLPEVRSVEVAGRRRQVLEMVIRRAEDAALAERLAATDRVQSLGWLSSGPRRLPVWVGGSGEQLWGDRPVLRGSGVVPLRSVADLRLHGEASRWTARLEGKEGFVLLIARELDASPLAFERALRRGLAESGLAADARIVRNEAEPLRELLRRLLWGLAAAVGVLVAAGFWLGGWRLALGQGLALPVSLAAGLNALWLLGAGLDTTTLPALWIAAGCSLVLLALRRTVASGWVLVAAGLALPVAAALAGGRLAPLVAAPSRAFAAALAAGTLALWVVPFPAPKARPPRAWGGLLQSVLRDPWTTLLGAATVCCLLVVVSGRGLSPRPGDLRPVLADLSVSLRFPPGTTRAQAQAQVAAVEARLDEREDVVEHWAIYDRDGASLAARWREADRGARHLRRVARRLEIELRSLGAAARVRPLAGGGQRDQQPIRFSDELEERPEIDEGMTFYRFVLRGTELRTLGDAHRQIRERIAKRMGRTIPTEWIRSDWGELETRLELVPRPGVSALRVERILPVLRRRASFPEALPLAAARSAGEEDLFLRIRAPDAPEHPDEIPQRQAVLGPAFDSAEGAAGRSATVSPSGWFEVREVAARPWAKRESGRFVLPVTVRMREGGIEASRRRNLMSLHHLLRTVTLPTEVDLSLPNPDPRAWGPERWRMVSVAAALPVLLLALAACRLSSVAAALVAGVPVVLGVITAAPFLLAARGGVDEMSLLGLAMVVAGSLPLAVEIAAAWLAVPYERSRSGGIAYRWLARRWPGVVTLAMALGVLLLVPGLGLGAERSPWMMPLRAAAVAGVVAWISACLVVPALLRIAGRLRHADRAAQRRQADPTHWRERPGLELRARNLTKIYGNGFQALHGVHFHLEPGIVGLLGPNGAGKTTLLRLLCGLIEPTRGQILFHGTALTPENRAAFRRRVGFLPQEFNAYEGFTGEQFLDYWALEQGMSETRRRRREVEELLEKVGLEDAATRKVRDFSGGMRRRIGIARALLGAPAIVIVDEPTTGLDVESRNRLRETLLRAAGERIILFSTHIASDVAATASRILLLESGRLRFEGSVRGLIEKARGRVFEAALADQELREFSHLYHVTTRVRTLDGIRVRAVLRGDQEPAGAIVEPNLEEAYLAVLGEEGERANVRAPGSAAAARPGSLLDVEAWRS